MSTENGMRLQQALDALVEETLQQPEIELLAEISADGENVESFVSRADHAIERAITIAGRSRLARAREQLTKRRSEDVPRLALDRQHARMLFERIRTRNSGLAQTLAARSGTEPTDGQIADILQDWLTLGAITEDDLKP